MRPILGKAWTRADRLIGPAIALIAALSVGYDRNKTLWSAGVPWVVSLFQAVTLSASGVGLTLLAVYGWVSLRRRTGQPPAVGTKLVAGAGCVLLFFSALSAAGAPAPLLSLARTAEIAVGLLAYLVVSRRPDLARWLVIGLACLVLVQIPFVTLQELTQSTFPEGQYVYGWGRDFPASSPGSTVIFGPDGMLWERAEGTFPHPNVIGGFLALALVLSLPLLECGFAATRPVISSRPVALLLIASWIFGWVELIFTFSRAALLAAAVGFAVWAIAQARSRGGRRLVAKLALAPALALIIGAVAAGPFLFPRIDPTPAQLNTTPVAGRFLLDRIALRVIETHPLLGIGAGNFAVIETRPPFDGVAVDPVHLVPLLVTAESGIPAGLAWLVIVLGGPVAAWRQWRFGARTCRRLAIPLAVLTIALLDHYLWTLGPGRSLFWIALAVGEVT